jgi:hypothetical protein
MKPLLFALALVACGNKHDSPREQASPQAAAPVATAEQAVGIPEVAGPGVQPAPTSGPRITIGKREVLLDDHMMVPVVDGALDSSVIVRDGVVSEIVAYVTPLPSPQPRAIVRIERTLPCKLIHQVLHSAAAAGLHDFGLAATQQGKHVIVPISLPRDPANAPLPELRDPPALGMALVVTRDRVKLWSASGLEGTERAPKLDRPLDGNFAELTKTLEDIVARRFAKRRLADDTVIDVAIDEGQSAQVLLDSLAAVAKSFPVIHLGIVSP